MKILHVFDHSLPLQSGYTYRSLAILRAQREMGWQTIHLTTPRHGLAAGAGPASQALEGFVFERTPAWPSTWARRLAGPFAEMAATTQRLETLVREHRPDVLHAHSPSLNAHPALQVGRRHGIPVVYELRALWEDAAVSHGSTPQGSLRYRLTRHHEMVALRRAHQVTTICEGLRQELCSRGLANDKVTVIPNAVDAQRFNPITRPSPALQGQLQLAGRWVIGFCGSFYAYEGLDLAIRALPDIIRQVPQATLLLVGGGPEDAALRALAQELGLAAHVVFAGRVPNEVVNDYYSLIDVLVFPRKAMRLTELVTPLKPLEAMAMGLPVVASDVGGHRELIEHERTGLLFEAGQTQALARTLLGLRAHPEQAAHLRREGRRFVEAERTWTRSVQRYESVYEAALRAPQRR
jgi:PEP-CTERM/exosortase A-associated glycosyltransferase